jgi:hypothetical protein
LTDLVHSWKTLWAISHIKYGLGFLAGLVTGLVIFFATGLAVERIREGQ